MHTPTSAPCPPPADQGLITVFEALGFGAALVRESDRVIVACNPRFMDVVGPAGAEGMRWTGRAPEEATGRTPPERWVHSDGTARWGTVRITRRGEDGRLWLVVVEDVTQAYAAELQRRTDAERLASALSSAGLATWDWNITTGEVRYSDRWAELRGFEPHEIAPHLSTWQNSVHPDDLPSVMAALDQHFRGLTDHYAAEHRTRTKSGEWRWIDDRGKVVARDAHGAPLRMTGTELDITTRKAAEQARIDSERRLATLMANLPGVAYRCQNQPDWPMEFVSEGILHLCGIRPEEFRENPLSLATLIHPDDRATIWLAVQDAVSRRQPFRLEYRLRTRAGEEKWVWEQGCGVFDRHGNLLALEGFITDITERKRAAADALQWKARYEAAALSSGQVLYDWDPAENTVSFGGPMKEILGYDVTEVDGKFRRWAELVHPDDRARFEEDCVRLTVTRENFQLCYRVRHKNGNYVPVEDTGRFVRIGGVDRAIGFVRDVSERQRAEDVRQRLEAQLRQSQKLEAIGQLSGGIAHDFNNLLTVIQGHVALLESEPSLDESLRASVAQIGHSAERAANLTAQLLTFSRRQGMQATRLDLNGVVVNAVAMLQRLLGETIELRTSYSSEPLVVQADAILLEQVVVNLAVNARDAMPDGGILQIETFCQVIRAGDLDTMPEGRLGPVVVLRVTDTGHGIKPENLPRIFEPFFTTKDVGKGTGLGLATVYGIVHQHEGWITVRSVLGGGSTFTVYLPRIAEEAEPPRSAHAPVHVAGHGQGILLAEDEDPVRMLLAAVLRKSGFTVFEAGSGPEALALWEEHAPVIRLLVTDLVMPGGMSGRVLAEQLLARKPDLGVIYMSGYSPDIGTETMALEPGVNFLAKPADLPNLIPIVHMALKNTGAAR